MTSIQETVHDTMRTAGLGNETHRAAPVIAALDTRERGIVDSLVAMATERGLSRDDAFNLCREAGLTVFSGTTNTGPVSDDLREQVENLRAQIRTMNEALDNITRTI
jgi:threonine synthase